MPQSREEMLAKKRAWQRAWYLAHPEESNARLKAQYQKHRDKRLAADKAKRQANIEQVRAKARTRQKEMLSNPESPRAIRFRTYQNQMQRHYNQLYPDKVTARNRKYRQGHLEQEREKGRLREAKRRKEHPEEVRAANATSLKAWRKNNPEQYRAKARQDAKERRAKKAQAVCTLSVEQEQEIKTAKGYRCDYCGKKDKRITIDHITPIGPDGPDSLWNVTTACRSCNASKGRKANPKPVQPLLLTIAPPKTKKG